MERELEKCNAQIAALFKAHPYVTNGYVSSLFEMESKILTDKMKVSLSRMVMEELPTAYSASLIPVAGNSTGHFDQAVKGKGKILVVIKAQGNQYVFGAFVEDIFGSPEGWITGHTHNFLFSLGTGGIQVKLHHSSANQDGVYISDCGLHMGDRQNNSELVAFCSYSTDLPRIYAKYAPESDVLPANTSISGPRGSFIPQVIEVFAIDCRESH